MAYMSQEGYDKLVAELKQLVSVERPKASAAIAEARDKGDLSENSEYDAAKEEQAKNAARIAEIQAILANAQEAGASSNMTVSIGCTVALVDGDGVATEITLVGTTETNSLEHKISNESPVGRAIIGHAEGETVEVVTPSGKSRTYTITKISR